MKNNFPWYDSQWLSIYLKAKEIIKKYNPNKLKSFEEAIQPFKTSPDFEVIEIPQILGQQMIEKLKQFIKKLENDKKETHEVFKFGRIVVHNDPLFNEIQDSLTELVSEQVKEEVEPSYNFLSLYYDMGVCDVHMDAPDAKWTLDICIEQSYDWPIQIAQTQDWIESFNHEGEDWSSSIKNNPDNKFESYSLESGSGIIFSGSSAWHYRDPIFRKDEKSYCHLIFFHFIPKGMKEVLDYSQWADLFDTPELENLVRHNVEQEFVFNQEYN